MNAFYVLCFNASAGYFSPFWFFFVQIFIEVKPAEIKLPVVPATPAIQLPKVVESLDQDSKQVWTLLKQKDGLYKAEIMAAFGWGKRRLNRALRTLQNRRLLRVQKRKLYALEPLI